MGLSPTRAPRPRSPWRGLIPFAWRIPLAALGFGLFFWLITGLHRGALPGLVAVSGIFATTISLLMWAGEHALYARVVRARPDGSRPVALTVAFFTMLSVVGSFLGLLLSNLLLHTRLLGSAAGLAVFAVFTLMFTALFMGITMAQRYYLEAMRRAREDEDLLLARRIQQSFLPERFPAGPGFDVHAVNISSRQVSGDFYDVVPAGEGGLLLSIADVSGKGFPAALLGSMLQASLRTQAGRRTPPPRSPAP
jgi:hypothetical protein